MAAARATPDTHTEKTAECLRDLAEQKRDSDFSTDAGEDVFSMHTLVDALQLDQTVRADDLERVFRIVLERKKVILKSKLAAVKARDAQSDNPHSPPHMRVETTDSTAQVLGDELKQLHAELDAARSGGDGVRGRHDLAPRRSSI